MKTNPKKPFDFNELMDNLLGWTCIVITTIILSLILHYVIVNWKDLF